MSFKRSISKPEIGNNIKKALYKRNKTQTWLAEQLGTTRQHVNAWCQSNTTPNSQNLSDIAKELDFTVEEIVTGNFRDEMTKVEETESEYHTIVESEKESIGKMIDIVFSDDTISSRKKGAYRRSIMRKIDMIVDIVAEEKY